MLDYSGSSTINNNANDADQEFIRNLTADYQQNQTISFRGFA